MTDSDALLARLTASPLAFRDASRLARLDRITYLLVALLAFQAVDVLELGPGGLVFFLIVGLFVTALLSDGPT